MTYPSDNIREALSVLKNSTCVWNCETQRIEPYREPTVYESIDLPTYADRQQVWRDARRAFAPFPWEVLLFGFSLGVLVTMTLIASYVLYNF